MKTVFNIVRRSFNGTDVIYERIKLLNSVKMYFPLEPVCVRNALRVFPEALDKTWRTKTITNVFIICLTYSY